MALIECIVFIQSSFEVQRVINKRLWREGEICVHVVGIVLYVQKRELHTCFILSNSFVICRYSRPWVFLLHAQR